MEISIEQTSQISSQRDVVWHKKLLRVIQVWQRNSHTRRHLKHLSDDMLKDIGLTRSDVAKECAKPFYWK
jgi:uncharacterized protein YjiS (DUF1127 family)